MSKSVFFLFLIFFVQCKKHLGARLTVCRHVRRALIRRVACGPIALFNLLSSSSSPLLGSGSFDNAHYTDTTASAPLVVRTLPIHVLLLSRRLTSSGICIGISKQIRISLNVFNLSLHCRHLLPLTSFPSSVCTFSCLPITIIGIA